MLGIERERERDVLSREPSAGAQVVKTITRKINMFFLLFVRTIMVGCGVEKSVMYINEAEELRLRLAQSRSKSNLVVKMARFF